MRQVAGLSMRLLDALGGPRQRVHAARHSFRCRAGPCHRGCRFRRPPPAPHVSAPLPAFDENRILKKCSRDQHPSSKRHLSRLQVIWHVPSPKKLLITSPLKIGDSLAARKSPFAQCLPQRAACSAGHRLRTHALSIAMELVCAPCHASSSRVIPSLTCLSLFRSMQSS